MIYEPEVAAFGGPDGIRVAHQLFHQDSRAVLAYRAGLAAGTPDHRRELTLLLCTALMRTAGLEWYEQGDVWFRVRQHRPGPVPEPPPRQLTTMRRFLSTDTTADSSLSAGNLAHAAHWLTAFRTTGTDLGEMARCGALTRGLRSVISYHILFHWNRLGLPTRDQELLASTACTAILGGPRDDHPTASPSQPLSTT